MAVFTRNVGEIDIVEIEGDITIGHHLGKPLDLRGRPVDDLRETIEQLLDRGRTRILINLAKVRFIDSSGLGELIACRKRALEKGGDIKLLNPAKPVEELLVLTLLTDLFEVFKDESEAIAAFG